MTSAPKTIKPAEIAAVLAENVDSKQTITCYVGSNAAMPSTLLLVLPEAIKSRRTRLPFMKIVHLFLQEKTGDNFILKFLVTTI